MNNTSCLQLHLSCCHIAIYNHNNRMSYRKQIWSEKRDSNSRPQPWQGCALPTELFSRSLLRRCILHNPLDSFNHLFYQSCHQNVTTNIVYTKNKSGVPKGIRTPVTAVKGRCPRPLDDGDNSIKLNESCFRLI